MKILWEFLWDVIQTLIALSLFLGSMWLLFGGLISALSGTGIVGLMALLTACIVGAIGVSTVCIVAINKNGEKK